MKVSQQLGTGAIRLDYDDVDAVGRFFDEVKEQQGFYLELEHELRQYQRIAFTAGAPPRFEFEFEAEVIQVFPGAAGCGTAFQLCWRPGQSEELYKKLRGRDDADPSQVSPAFRIRNMNVNERFRLATQASRTERQILLRDSSPQVLMGLLAHPRLEIKEVLEIVKSNHSTGGTMERVAKNRKWMANPEVRTAIVKNPKTPSPLAIKLLDGLHVNDLRVLAKSGSVRENLRRAALRVYLSRSGKR